MISDDDITRTEALLAILRREHDALLGGDLEALEQAVRAKRDTAVHFEQLLRTAGDTPPHDARRMRLADLATACRHQNETNGAMVESGLRHVRAMLGVLRGTPADGGLYTRHGESRSADPGARPLARA